MPHIALLPYPIPSYPIQTDGGSCHGWQLLCWGLHGLHMWTPACHRLSSSEWIHHMASWVVSGQGIWEPCTIKEGQWWRSSLWPAKHLKGFQTGKSIIIQTEFKWTNVLLLTWLGLASHSPPGSLTPPLTSQPDHLVVHPHHCLHCCHLHHH